MTNSTNGVLGSFNGTVTADVNMLDIFKENELKQHPNSTLQFSRLTIKKIGIQCDPGTEVEINGSKIPIISGVFELGFNQVNITSLVFKSAVPANIYYMY
ncbi:MAG: hypothetical protein NC548_44055 [Lachnospiraceae bacterium]|nr:hypothetical protein [Lachnospiraceae bacterium]